MCATLGDVASSAKTDTGGLSPGSRRRSTGPRLVRTAVIAAVRDAREANLITAAEEPLALLAITVAGQIDTAAKTDSADQVVRLSKTLRELLAVLPLRADDEGTPRDDAAGDDPAPAGADPFDAELEKLVGSGPSVGDTAYT